MVSCSLGSMARNRCSIEFEFLGCVMHGREREGLDGGRREDRRWATVTCTFMCTVMYQGSMDFGGEGMELEVFFVYTEVILEAVVG